MVNQILLYPEESYIIRGACFEVWKRFRGFFREKIVDRSLKKEIELRGLKVISQHRIDILYKGDKVGTYIPDQIIEDKILMELKVKPFLTQEDERQFWYYLRGSDYKLGFLVNFGSKQLEIKRRVYDKARDKYPPLELDSASNQRAHPRQSASMGLTFIELLLVMAIVLVVGALGTTYYSRLLTQNAVTNTADQLVNQLRKAQTYAMTGKESGGVWGVKYTASPKRITLFLNGSAGFDEHYSVNTNITISGLTQITYGHATALPTPAGPTTITITGNNDVETVTVNEQGVVSRN